MAVLRALLVEDNLDDAELLVRELQRANHACTWQRVENAETLAAALAEREWDLVFVDYALPGFGARQALAMIRAAKRGAPAIVVSGSIGEETAAELMREGARDFLIKGRLSRLGPVVQRELAEAAGRRAIRETEASLEIAERQLRQSQKMEAIGRLAGGVAHDFNNILTVILGQLDLSELLVGEQPELRDRLRRAREAAERAATLTRQMLTFSRGQLVQARLVDLRALVGEMEGFLRRLIGEDIEFAVSLPAAPLTVRVDPGQFTQVVMNLAVNARDAMPGGGTLTLQVHERSAVAGGGPSFPEAGPGTYAVLSVMDSGTGMDEATRSRLFEPFFTTKDPGKGTGLGLATVYGIIRQAGGYLEVETDLECGTTFHVCLPVVPASEAARPAVPASPVAPAAHATILVVDDEEPIRLMVADLLAARGHRVLTAADGEDALAVAAGHAGPIALLVTDIVMPRLGGRELAEQLRRARPGIRVLGMSGYAVAPAGGEGAAGAIHAYLDKPFSTHALLARVDELLEGAAA